MASLVEYIVTCHALLTEPKAVDFRGMVALETANPRTFTGPIDAMAVAAELRGWSKAECRRRGVSMSEEQDTVLPALKWASVKMGRNDYEPIYIEWTRLP